MILVSYKKETGQDLIDLIDLIDIRLKRRQTRI